MDAKLVLDEKYYYLETQHERIGKMVVGSSDHELSRIVNQPFKLSTKNCEAIKNGYDLDELAFQSSMSDVKEHSDMYRYLAMRFFKEGFQKALSILGDKKFSEDDMKKSCAVGIDIATKEGENDFTLFEDLLQSLQQTEWEVEIVMESNLHIGEVIDESYPKDFPLERPKLDANGCIILKRK